MEGEEMDNDNDSLQPNSIPSVRLMRTTRQSGSILKLVRVVLEW
jgi:hypothetical protein